MCAAHVRVVSWLGLFLSAPAVPGRARAAGQEESRPKLVDRARPGAPTGLEPGGSLHDPVSVLATALADPSAPPGILSLTMNAPGGTIARVVDRSGIIFELTVDRDGILRPRRASRSPGPGATFTPVSPASPTQVPAAPAAATAAPTTGAASAPRPR